MALSIAEIESNIQEAFSNFNQESFIYDFLLSYGTPKATIASLKAGRTNLSKVDGEILWKKKMFFKIEQKVDLHGTISEMKETSGRSKDSPRFLIVTDFKHWLSVDTLTGDTLDCDFEDLKKHFDFYLPFAGIEKAQYLAENPADVKAAEKMAKLYDQINTDNEFETEEDIHQLNVFLSRLLFCFFAEDTGIFDDKIFTNSIISNTKTDASDVEEFVRDLFQILNLPDEVRPTDRVYLHKFPYVNGGLFREQFIIPQLSVKSRNLIIECGNLDWSEINPDIFGSMIQAVVTTDKRGGLGMHYTSVPNIMKVINPLFLDDLHEELKNATGNEKQLRQLLDRLSKIKIFDPACGSGNFLIIAYKELRLLENEILNQIAVLKGSKGSGTLDLGSEFSSIISLNQFFGIEIDDFAHEIARLSLWLAEHQMNQLFHKEFGYTKPALPLQDSGSIVGGNACRLDWEQVCPKSPNDEIYIFGNPPFLGARKQSEEQKQDMEYVFRNSELNFNSLDYILIWFYKASIYIKGMNNSVYSFVSTNSICQGEQVGLFWPFIFKNRLEINFAYSAFPWGNNAKKNAVVAVIIVSIKNVLLETKKKIFSKNNIKIVNNIGPYLTENSNLIIEKRSKPFLIDDRLVYGNQAIDNGFLELDVEGKRQLLLECPNAIKFIRRLYGGNDYINKIERYCLWIDEENSEEALKIPFIYDRVQKVLEFRKNGGQVAKSLINIPFRFRYVHESTTDFIILPKVTSVNRKYLPISIVEKDSIALQTLQVIYNLNESLYSILSSCIHMLWVKAVAGGMKTDIVYSNQLCFNSYPFPKITKAKEQELEDCAYQILEVRERYPEKTLAQLYDPEKMPEDLKEAHRKNDLVVESCYREKPFTSDEERLEYLFKLYEKMTKTEK
ncbi:class I SAM-dependent DNA methyltransferase [Empedobacter tilapiae]|uniref:site-specific DNA-methyltransferase (adenine-specific) n=1 Tax=Empedobacter tilapiae TaxID=2491114 RepID=A0A4Z1BG57_9FLAO|nr:DNA methyltransferase [Empedobacter tilapiae]TGN29178.1 class I SAM-dependent DNA methyltransferase [Empedobacter tilapiae]